MKIFSAAQIRACDNATIKNSKITSAELMERAAHRCTAWLKAHFAADTLFLVLCGSGNNGGDGLAITRMLHHMNFGAKAFVLQMDGEQTADCKQNLKKLQAINTDLVGTVANGTFIAEIPEHIVIVDAILGTGLNRPVTGWLQQFIEQVNKLPNKKIAIDIPSGLSADSLPTRDAAVLKADFTLSFQFLKRTYLHEEAYAYVGDIHLLDIHLDQEYIDKTHSIFRTTDLAEVKRRYRPRHPYAHKGTNGNVLIAAGSYGKIGAAILASKAAHRAGAGLVTALIPECGYSAMQAASPETMCRTEGYNYLDVINDWENYRAIAIGPGLGMQDVTTKALANVLEQCNRPLVLDADALNIIANQPELLKNIPKHSIITPHPKEYSRLFGPQTDSLTLVDHARLQAMRLNICIVLKGKHTAVILPDGDCYYNQSGCEGMATAGTGDTLTGMICGLLAQGYDTNDAALLGVYLHGLAGQLAADTKGIESMTAKDLIEEIGNAYSKIKETPIKH